MQNVKQNLKDMRTTEENNIISLEGRAVDVMIGFANYHEDNEQARMDGTDNHNCASESRLRGVIEDLTSILNKMNDSRAMATAYRNAADELDGMVVINGNER